MLRKLLHSRWCSRTCPRTPRSTLPPVLALHAIACLGQRSVGGRCSPLHWIAAVQISRQGSVRRHIRPPPIRGPPEVHAYTDSDDDDEEEEEDYDDMYA